MYAFTSVLFEVVLMMSFQNGVGFMPSVAILYSVLHMFLQALMLHPDRLQSEQASGPKLDHGSQTPHFFRFNFRLNGKSVGFFMLYCWPSSDGFCFEHTSYTQLF